MRNLALALTLVASSASAQASSSAETISLTPTAAVDTAIWVHPTDVRRSLIFGTDQIAGGLASYFLDGGRAELVNLGLTRAVDVRYGVKLDGRLTDVVLVVGVNGVFRLLAPDGDAGRLSPLDLAFTSSGSNANAAALSLNPADGTLMIYISDFAGNVRHFTAVDDGQGHLAATLTRTVPLGSPVEGIAADDRGQRLFITIANRGLYALEAASTGSTMPTLVDSIDAGRLAGAKGVALYFTADGGGYVIASASQTSRFPVYSLGNGFPFVTSFNLVADAGGKGTTNSAGIDVMPLSLGAPFDKGLFVAHDPNNFSGPNYKLVKWDAIALRTTPPLAVDPSFDPRTRAGPDAGSPDAGTKCPVTLDAGTRDGGTASDGGAGDAGADAGVVPCSGAGGGRGGSVGLPPIGSGGSGQEPASCGCTAAGALIPLAAVLLLLRRRRL